MPHHQSIDIRCEIESLEGAIRGELRDQQGRSLSFSGWTEFATGLMALAGGPKEQTNTNTEENDHVHE